MTQRLFIPRVMETGKEGGGRDEVVKGLISFVTDLCEGNTFFLCQPQIDLGPIMERFAEVR